MINPELPFWMAGQRAEQLRAMAFAWWSLVQTWLEWPASQIDPLTCALPMLKLLAWQRDISPLAGEPLALFRKRVALAYVNAADAGEKAGFEVIFDRLGVGPVVTHERVDAVNWDVIEIELIDNQMGIDQPLQESIVRTYGRTCRRYRFTSNTPLTMRSGLVAVGIDYAYSKASSAITWDSGAVVWDGGLMTWTE